MKSEQKKTIALLHKLNIPIQLSGYKFLRIGITNYAENNVQSLSKELYPFIASQVGFGNADAVESAIRKAIGNAWDSRDPEVWDVYFPGHTKAPSNLVFIATLAEYLE